jgi:hypothetical protein
LLHSAKGDFALNGYAGDGATNRLGWFPWSVTLAAILIRVREYAANKAFWLDEAYLGLNVVHRDYADLIGPLEYDQGAPLGFLFLSRAAVLAFGSSEYVLRLFPFLASIAAPPVFLLVARRLLAGTALNVAVVLFAFSIPLTHYASEFKPYSVDVLAALVLTLLMLRYADRRSTSNAVVLAVAGAMAIPFSFASIFVLAGGGVALFFDSIGMGFRKPAVLRLIVVGACWILAFGTYYWYNLRHLTGNEEVVAWHSDSYMPLLPNSLGDLYWFLSTFVAMFEFPVGLSLPGLGLLLSVLGTLFLIDRIRVALPLLVLPLVVALIASGLMLYPFHQRFLLFLTPALVILAAAGIGFILDNTRGRIVAGACIVVMLVHPVSRSAINFVDPRPETGLRPIMAHLADHRRPEDYVYVYHWAHPTFRFYAPRYGVSLDHTATDASSRRDWGYYIGSIDPLLGRDRVWFVFEHAGEQLSGGEEQFFVTYLDSIGTRLDHVATKTASTYLYDLSKANP